MKKGDLFRVWRVGQELPACNDPTKYLYFLYAADLSSGPIGLWFG
jgi:hypothetical protein